MSPFSWRHISFFVLEEMCYERKFGTTACAKLYKKSLIEQFPFPKGRLYEDLSTIYKVIGTSKKIVFIQKAMYHYVQRKGSIRKSIWNDSVFDVVKASDELLSYISKYYPDIKKAAVQRYFFSANEVFTHAFGQDNYLELIRDIREKLKIMFSSVITNNKISIKQKFRYFLMTFLPRTYRTIWISHVN